VNPDAAKFFVPGVRPLTADERRLLEHLLLKHGTPAAAAYRTQLPYVTVVSHCSCGCPTIDLAVAGRAAAPGPSTILADLDGSSPEGALVGVLVHGREELISELEVYSLAGEGGFSLPRIEDLHPAK
jgi:hypothetical protein